MAFPLVPVLGALAPIIERLFPDPQAAAEAKLKMFELQQAGELKELEANLQIALAQASVNAEEAKSPSLFKSGWRPAVGWLCVAGFAYMTVLRPLLPWMLNVVGVPAPAMPAVDTSETTAILLGMLGLGGMRSFERVLGRA